MQKLHNFMGKNCLYWVLEANYNLFREIWLVHFYKINSKFRQLWSSSLAYFFCFFRVPVPFSFFIQPMSLVKDFSYFWYFYSCEEWGITPWSDPFLVVVRQKISNHIFTFLAADTFILSSLVRLLIIFIVILSSVRYRILIKWNSNWNSICK